MYMPNQYVIQKGIPKPKRKKQSSQTDKPLDPSLLQTLGQGALGVAGAAGNLLSLPGSSVIDALAGRNPLDQWMTPFSDANRTSGRELNRMYGLTGKEDTWGNFAGGLATEFLTDPFILTGASALGKTAKGLGKVKAGQAVSKSLAKGVKAGDRALLSGKVPFGPSWGLGTGKKSVKLAGKIDRVAQKVKGSEVGRATGAMFDYTKRGIINPIGQKFSQAAETMYETGLPKLKSEQFMIARQLDKLKLTDPVKLRGDLEGIPKHDGYLPKALKAKIRNNIETTRRLKAAYGLHSDILDDQFAKYFPRGVKAAKGEVENSMGKVAGISSKLDRQRDVLFKNFKDATEGANNLFRDKAVRSIINAYDAEKISRTQAHQDITKHLELNYGNEYDPVVRVKGKPKANPEYAAWSSRKKDSPRSQLKAQLVEQHADLLAADPEMAKKLIQEELRASAPPKTIIPVTEKSRHKLLASYIVRHGKDAIFDEGLFNRSPLKDLSSYQLGNWRSITNAHALNETLFDFLPESVRQMKDPSAGQMSSMAGRIKPGDVADKAMLSPKIQKLSKKAREDSESIAQLFSKVGSQNSTISARAMLDQHGIDVTEDTLAAVLNTRIPKEHARAIEASIDKFKTPRQVGPVKQAYKSYLNWFKGTVLAHPATKTRDYIGGMAHSILNGIATPKSYFKAHNIYQGGDVKGLVKVLGKNQAVLDWAKSNGMNMATDKDATDVVRYLYAALGPGDVFKHTDVSGAVLDAGGQGLDSVLGMVPGYKQSTLGQNFKDFGRTFVGKDGATLNPLDIRGVGERGESKFGPVAAFDKLGGYTDTMNRLAPFTEMLSQGWEPGAAMKRINDVHVNYNPEHYTETEKMLKLVFPFYSYSSRMAKHVGKELVTNPGGGIANAVRVQNTARDRSGQTPDHLADTAAIMVNDDPATGITRYLSGLGLMHTDGLELASPNILAELGSRLNPLAQKAIEGATGTSMYFKGPDGGRPINELDPSIGRILANVSGSEDAVTFPGSRALETAVGLTPYSRVTTTLRQLTDPRKDIRTKLSNTLTGFKFTDVSPQQKERTIKRRLEEAAKSLGARTFEQVYIPQGQSQSQQAKEKLDAYMEIIRALGKESQKRRKKDQIRDKKRKG